MSLLGLGAAVMLLAVLAVAGRNRLRPAPMWALLGLYVAPAAFVALLVGFAPAEAHRLRLSLLGVGFRGPADDVLAVAVGGDRAEHEVWVSAFAREEDEEAPPPAGTVRFDPRWAGDTESADNSDNVEEESQVVNVSPENPEEILQAIAGIGSAGVLAVDVEGTPRPVAAFPLADGDLLTVDGRTWTVRLSSLPWRPPAVLATPGFDPIELPRRSTEIPLLGWKVPLMGVYSSAQQTYPLPAGDPAASPLLFFEPQGFAGGTLFALAAPGAVQIERGGEVVPPPGPTTLWPERRLRVLSLPSPSDDPGRAGGFVDRRSFRVISGERSLAFLYDTPEVHSLGPADLEALRIDAGWEGQDARRISLSLGNWQVVERSLYLSHASDAVASEALASLNLPESLLARWRLWPGELGAATPRGSFRGQYGEPLWLGDWHAAAVQIDVLRPPFVLAILGLVLALVKAVTARSVRLPAAAALVAAGLEGLVGLRLVLGYRVWAAEPHRPEAMELALVAWSLLPWTFLAASAPAGEEEGGGWRSWLLPSCGLLFSLAWCLRLGGDGLRSLGWVGCHVAALAVPLGRRLLAGRRIPEGLRFLNAPVVAKARTHPVVLWSLAAIVFLLARTILLGLGFRESVVIGERVALSLVHVPAAVLLEAGYLLWLWRRGVRRGRVTTVDLVPTLAIVLGVWVGPAFLVSDLGLGLLGLPVFVLALVAVLGELQKADVRIAVADPRGPALRRWRRSLRWTDQAVAAALVLVVVSSALAIVSPLGARAIVAAIPDESRLELESERNFLRLLGYAYPDELARVGRRSSEELAIMAAVMGAYTGGPLAGRGWFGSEWSPHIATTALREHVPSAFVAAEWGIYGTMGLVALYLLVGWGPAGAFLWQVRGGKPTTLGGAVAALAAATLAIGGIYMVAANYRLVLFTGKNAYLLGLDSTADVLESWVLALIVAAGLAAARDRETLW